MGLRPRVGTTGAGGGAGKGVSYRCPRAVTLQQRSPKSSPKGYVTANGWGAQGAHLPLACGDSTS